MIFKMTPQIDQTACEHGQKKYNSYSIISSLIKTHNNLHMTPQIDQTACEHGQKK